MLFWGDLASWENASGSVLGAEGKVVGFVVVTAVMSQTVQREEQRDVVLPGWMYQEDEEDMKNRMGVRDGPKTVTLVLRQTL